MAGVGATTGEENNWGESTERQRLVYSIRFGVLQPSTLASACLGGEELG